MKQVKRADFAHFVPMDVRWGEMDSLGHVNNTVFYQYSEEGRLQYLRRLLPEQPAADASGPILGQLSCRFVQQLRYPAQLEIATRTTGFGNSSMRMQQALFYRGEDNLIATYDAVLVWFDFKRQHSDTLPQSLRSSIRELEVIAPED